MYHIYVARWRLERKNLAWLTALPQTQSLERENIFRHYRKKTKNITTIIGRNGHIVGSGRVMVVLPNNTSIFIEEDFCTRELYALSSHSKIYAVVATTLQLLVKMVLNTFMSRQQTNVGQKWLRKWWEPPLEFTTQKLSHHENTLRCLLYLKILSLLRSGMKDSDTLD